MGNVISKLENTRLLSRNPLLVDHIPLTLPLTLQNARFLLSKHPFVYLKPDNSCQGKGLFRIDRKPSGYLLRSRDHQASYHHANLSSLLDAVRKMQMKRHYIIQQGIPSMTKDGRMVDVRVHLMRIDGHWVIAGMVARVAPENGFVTNAYSGGVSKYVEDILSHGFRYSHKKTIQTIKQLKKISLAAARTMSKKYPKWPEYGVDIGIDGNGHLWIYEINIKPGTLVFKNLGQKDYFHLIRLRKRAS